MQLTRRTMITGTGALGLVALSGTARANPLDNWSRMRRIFERHWSGSASTPSRQIEGGEFATSMELDFVPADDMTLSGSYSIKTNYENSIYHGTYDIQGYIWGRDNALGIVIERARMSQGDALPSELIWQGYLGQLELFRSTGTEDNWLLDGTLRGTSDGLGYRTTLFDH